MCEVFAFVTDIEVLHLSVLEFLMLNNGMCCKALGKLQADCGVCLD